MHSQKTMVLEFKGRKGVCARGLISVDAKFMRDVIILMYGMPKRKRDDVSTMTTALFIISRTRGNKEILVLRVSPLPYSPWSYPLVL